jgi:hypothetical protein
VKEPVPQRLTPGFVVRGPESYGQDCSERYLDRHGRQQHEPEHTRDVAEPKGLGFT